MKSKESYEQHRQVYGIHRERDKTQIHKESNGKHWKHGRAMKNTGKYKAFMGKVMKNIGQVQKRIRKLMKSRGKHKEYTGNKQ